MHQHWGAVCQVTKRGNREMKGTWGKKENKEDEMWNRTRKKKNERIKERNEGTKEETADRENKNNYVEKWKLERGSSWWGKSEREGRKSPSSCYTQHWCGVLFLPHTNIESSSSDPTILKFLTFITLIAHKTMARGGGTPTGFQFTV